MAREFTVFSVLNGWVVKIGCTFIAYTDKAIAEKDFSEYLADPDKKEREMLARYAPEKIFPNHITVGSDAKMPAQPQGRAESTTFPSFGGGIEKALRR